MELKHLNLYFTRKLCTSSTIIKRVNPENYILLKEEICKMNRKKLLKDSGRLSLFDLFEKLE